MATDAREGVLIVDDEEIIRRSIHKKLAKEGYRCEEAGSAEEALQKLRGDSPELVILDIKMPGRSGCEVLPEIRQSHPETAVIMATAVTEPNVIIQCMKEGAHDYISKPFNLDDVVESVDRALKQKKLERDIKEHQEHLEQKVEEDTREIRRLFLGAIEAMISALEAKDVYTAGHSRRVSQITLAVGRELDLSPDELENLRWGALLHDVGKLAVDPAIQNKPGRLTPDEYQHIMAHANIGAGIVRSVVNDRIVETIRHHHDHYDGTGLGQTVTGDHIPLGARILAIADTYDAMTSDRPYRDKMPPEAALAEIRRCTGTQFDPAVVSVFLKIPVTELVRCSSDHQIQRLGN